MAYSDKKTTAVKECTFTAVVLLSFINLAHTDSATLPAVPLCRLISCASYAKLDTGFPDRPYLNGQKHENPCAHKKHRPVYYPR